MKAIKLFKKSGYKLVENIRAKDYVIKTYKNTKFSDKEIVFLKYYNGIVYYAQGVNIERGIYYSPYIDLNLNKAIQKQLKELKRIKIEVN